MNTPAANATQGIETISTFLPIGAKQAFIKTSTTLQSGNVPVEQMIQQSLAFGDALVEQGLDKVVELYEILVEQLYELGIMEKIGDINSFARDGLEIGIQLSLNTLKALEPADVAKIVAIGLLAWLAPNALLLNAPDFLSMGMEIATKIWHLP